jgi:hypothetical protein
MQALLSGSSIAAYSITFIAASALYVMFALFLRRRVLSRSIVFILIGVGIAVRAALLPLHPIGSDDIYRYLWDGRVQAAGIDPYAYAPADSALAHLHTAELPARVNNPAFRTPYPPLTQWLFRVAWAISADGIIGMKILLFIAECLTLLMIVRALRVFALPLQNILLYALCPLPLFMFALDAHVDGLGLPLLLLALVQWRGERRITSLIVLGLSLSIKPVGLVLLPGLFILSRSWRERVLVVVLPLLVVGVQFLPYLWTSDPIAGIAAFGRNWSYNGAVFEIVFAVARNNITARIVCGAVLAFALLFVAVRRDPLPAMAYRSVFLLLIFSPVVHPWYIAWLGVLIPIFFSWSGISFTALASLTSITVVNYLTFGVWGIHPWILALEYLPVVGLFGVEIARKDSFHTQSD